jgi:hypothetical protein
MYATYQVYAKLNFAAQMPQYFEIFLIYEPVNNI